MTRDEILNMPAGREMDELIAEKVMRWPHIGPNDPFRNYKEYSGVIINGVAMKFPELGNGLVPSLWRPSFEISDADDVIEEAATEYSFFELVKIAQTWKANFIGNVIDDARAETRPLAICRAALLAIMEPQA